MPLCPGSRGRSVILIPQIHGLWNAELSSEAAIGLTEKVAAPPLQVACDQHLCDVEM